MLSQEPLDKLDNPAMFLKQPADRVTKPDRCKVKIEMAFLCYRKNNDTQNDAQKYPDHFGSRSKSGKRTFWSLVFGALLFSHHTLEIPEE